MNSQFELACIELAPLNIGINTTSKVEHSTEIDRINCTIKKRVRATYNKLNLHLTNIAGVITREMFYSEFFWINSFPATYRTYDAIIP